MRFLRFKHSIVLLMFAVVFVIAKTPAQNDWSEQFPAFRIAGNLYYVGSRGLANYLIATPQGHILINSDLEPNVPLIRASVESLGFKFSDIKILLISHAHWDHCAASALIKNLTGAKYMVMDADVPVVESGGKADFHYANDASTLYPPAKVDRVLHDGDEVRLGDTVLTARLTPGHTKGCTTWTMKVKEGSKTRDVVIVGSPNVNPGYQLVGSKLYPEMARDFQRGFDVLKSLSCDYFLGAHGSYFDMEAKYAKFKAGDATAFIDPAGYKSFVAEKEQSFQRELEKQKRTALVLRAHATAPTATAQEPVSSPSPAPNQTTLAAPLPEYVIEVRRPDGCLVNTISTKSKRGYVLYTLPRPAKRDNAGRPISKVFVSATQNGEKWDVKVSIGSGEFYDAGDTMLGDFKLDLNQRAEVTDFSRFQLSPIRVGVAKLIRQGAREPKVENITRSISLEKIEATDLPEPFKLELKNNYSRDLIAIQYNTFSRSGVMDLKWLSPGLLNSLIKTGESYKLEVNSEDKTCGNDEGYRPNQSTRINLVSAVFADGTYEGEPALAALIRGTALGNRANLEPVVEALRYASDPAELYLLLNDLQERLNEEANPYQVEVLCGMFPAIARESKSALIGFIRAGMHEVKVNLARDAQYLRMIDERPNPQASKRWVERTKSKYERWHAAAENMTAH